MWALYAVLSAVFAAVTTILAKKGLAGVNSHLATAIRTIVILAVSWGMVFIAGAQKQLPTLTKNNILFLVLSGVATGASWLFYFKALQMGQASKVAPIDKLSIVFTILLAAVFLKEPFTFKTVVGMALLTGGIFVLM
ncbi:MAG: EamA family transporter [Oscillospiraceae bacterium]